MRERRSEGTTSPGGRSKAFPIAATIRRATSSRPPFSGMDNFSPLSSTTALAMQAITGPTTLDCYVRTATRRMRAPEVELTPDESLCFREVRTRFAIATELKTHTSTVSTWAFKPRGRSVLSRPSSRIPTSFPAAPRVTPNPSIEGTLSGLRPPSAPHVKR
jgi:hypothetical protein